MNDKLQKNIQPSDILKNFMHRRIVAASVKLAVLLQHFFSDKVDFLTIETSKIKSSS